MVGIHRSGQFPNSIHDGRQAGNIPQLYCIHHLHHRWVHRSPASTTGQIPSSIHVGRQAGSIAQLKLHLALAPSVAPSQIHFTPPAGSPQPAPPAQPSTALRPTHSGSAAAAGLRASELRPVSITNLERVFSRAKRWPTRAGSHSHQRSAANIIVSHLALDPQQVLGAKLWQQRYDGVEDIVGSRL
jgi:hypothetical protein